MSKNNVTTNPNPAIKAIDKEKKMKNLSLEQILGHAGHPTNPLDVRALVEFGNFLGFEHAEYDGEEAYASIYVDGFPVFQESSLSYTITADDVLALIASLLAYGQKEMRTDAGLMAAGTIAALALAARPGINAWDWEWICDAGSKAWMAQQCSHVPAPVDYLFGNDSEDADAKFYQVGDVNGFEEPLWKLRFEAEAATKARHAADVAVERLIEESQDWDDNDLPF